MGIQHFISLHRYYHILLLLLFFLIWKWCDSTWKMGARAHFIWIKYTKIFRRCMEKIEQYEHRITHLLLIMKCHAANYLHEIAMSNEYHDVHSTDEYTQTIWLKVYVDWARERKKSRVFADWIDVIEVCLRRDSRFVGLIDAELALPINRRRSIRMETKNKLISSEQCRNPHNDATSTRFRSIISMGNILTNDRNAATWPSVRSFNRWPKSNQTLNYELIRVFHFINFFVVAVEIASAPKTLTLSSSSEAQSNREHFSVRPNMSADARWHCLPHTHTHWHVQILQQWSRPNTFPSYHWLFCTLNNIF